MKERVNGLGKATKIAYGIDHIVNIIIAACLLVAFLYGGFGLWDTWQIYSGAGLDNELLKYKPSLDEDSHPTLAELQKINPDVCAWLTVDGTNIDYPVVQGESNVEYVNKDVYGVFSLSGSVFLDYRNASDFSDYYSLLYGHHMAGNVMFGELTDFLEESYFNEHTSGTLYLPDCTYKIEWFSCMNTQAYDNEVFYPSGVKMEASKSELLNYIKQNAVQYREIGVTTSEQIIGLATCSDTRTNGRALLFGRMSKI
jgi:sortase B